MLKAKQGLASDTNQYINFKQAVKLNLGSVDPLINSTLNSEMEQEEPLKISKPLQLCSCLVFLFCSFLCYFSHRISHPAFNIIAICCSCASSITKSTQVFALRKTQIGQKFIHPFINIPEQMGICCTLKGKRPKS